MLSLFTSTIFLNTWKTSLFYDLQPILIFYSPEAQLFYLFLNRKQLLMAFIPSDILQHFRILIELYQNSTNSVV